MRTFRSSWLKDWEVEQSFMQQILDGQWDESVKTLPEIGIHDEQITKFATVLILEQKYLELLHQAGKTEEALAILRDEIVPIRPDGRIQARSLPLGMPQSKPFDETSRKKLLDEIQKLKTNPETRLVSLTEYAMRSQLDLFRVHDLKISLFDVCGRVNSPSQRLRVLHGHSETVLFLAFSHTGEYLASASADRSVIIWEVKTDGQVSVKHRLSKHESHVCYVSWSPDDKQILTCGYKETVRQWDVVSGNCLCVYGHTYSGDGGGLVSCVWDLEAKSVFTGYADCKNRAFNISQWDLQADDEFQSSQLKTLCNDLGITADEAGTTVVITLHEENTIMIKEWGRHVSAEFHNVNTGSRTRYIKENARIGSFTLSEDRKFLLVSLRNAEIHLWSIDDAFVVKPKLVAKYDGHKSISRFGVRSCFGGHGQAYIASGSENSMVYIWDRSSAELIATLKGHAKAVKCVSWNPANPHMLASASNDGLIRIWVSIRAAIKIDPCCATDYLFEEKKIPQRKRPRGSG